MAFVLDASVPIAIYKREPGADGLLGRIGKSFIGIVNFHEFAEHLVRLGANDSVVPGTVMSLPYTIIEADRSLAFSAARLARVTRRAGLSLGDRFCLALAKQMNLPALTGDRRWLDVADEIGGKVELFR